MNEDQETTTGIIAILFLIGAGVAAIFYNNYQWGFFLNILSYMIFTSAKDSEIDRLKKELKNANE